MILVPAAALAADFRGFASAGPMGLILFQECRGSAPAARVVNVEDATQEGTFSAGIEAVRRIMLNAGRPLYVEFSGDASGQAIKARQFQRAVGTFQSCAAAAPIAPGVQMLAAGDDPSWRFVAAVAAATLERPGQKTVRFPPGPFNAKPRQDLDGPTRVIDAWSALDGGTVRVELTAEMCSDGRSETAYGAKVVLRYGSRTYEGCAARF
ncbi:MAG TPA: hypothetical protein VJ501_15870 [Burkholderiaceae bacterium]|nr:hypothetical protein [Burkholderiaceae bacterium]